MKRMYSLFLAVIIQSIVIAAWGNQLNQTEVMDETWREFRQIHPYGYQTVALKHVGNDCVFVISEPSESISEEMLSQLFHRYGGSMVVKHQPLGYDGWLGDAVGIIQSPNDHKFDDFTRELFNFLYGTDYKAYYTDLDNPSKHVYFSENRLNYSISAAELSKWFVADKEQFKSSEGNDKTLTEILSNNINGTNDLFYSKERGFVAWVVSPDKISINDKSFAINARKFALDTDLIIGALGKVGSKVAIIARERIVPVTVLPPLRIETIQLLATTENDNLAQSFEMYNVFAGKNSKNQDSAPIYLSDELWHTEYGNLLNMTDQMLKSWTENNEVHDYNYDYPVPIDWAFTNGAFREIVGISGSLTYNWNTAGAGYVIQDMEKLDVFAVNRTGSLPVSFIPDGMEGKVDEKVNEAEELAYDFFSELNSPELVREVQYATIYQIFRYFRNTTPKINVTIGKFSSLNPRLNNYDDLIKYADTPIPYFKKQQLNETPSFTVYENIIENLLKVVSDTTSSSFTKCYNEGLKRFSDKFYAVNAHIRLKELIANDPYNSFVSFLSERYGQDNIDNLLMTKPTTNEIREQFDKYLFESIDTILPYIKHYEKMYGNFPFSEAAKYIVCSRSLRGFENLKEYVRIASLRLSGNREKALGALNWLLTDPGSFESPTGAFYASKFTSHRKWIKSSPVTCSTFRPGMYGGHNLDAHITPIKTSTSTIPKEYCKVSVVRGQRVLSVSNVDKARITPAVLRSIERTTDINELSKAPKLIKLPKAPAERSKFHILETGYAKGDRGLILAEHSDASLSKRTIVNGQNVESVSDIQEMIAKEIAETGTSSVKEIHFRGHTAREVHVYADNLKECIVERMPEEGMSLKKFDINEDIQVVSQGDGTVKIVLEQRLETLPQYGPCKAAMLDITVPEKLSGIIKKALFKVFKLPEDKINNRFKWKRELRQELQQEHPEIDSNDIKDELIQLYGHIFNTNDYEIFFKLAA